MAIHTADHLGLDKTLIKKVTVAEMQQAAIRPLKTGFNIEKAKKELGFTAISFKAGLEKTFTA
jgi:dTDP-4-dehydrorhamnose reductase